MSTHPVIAAPAVLAALLLPATITAPAQAATVTVTAAPTAATKPHHSRHWWHCHTKGSPCAKHPSAARARVLAAARAALGKPYRYGATGPSAYDCSGLVVAAYRAAGKRVPRTSQALAHAGHAVTRARPGDVLVYAGAGHVAIVAKVNASGRVLLTIVARKTGTTVAYQAPYTAYSVRSLLA